MSPDTFQLQGSETFSYLVTVILICSEGLTFKEFLFKRVANFSLFITAPLIGYMWLPTVTYCHQIPAGQSHPYTLKREKNLNINSISTPKIPFP